MSDEAEEIAPHEDTDRAWHSFMSFLIKNKTVFRKPTQAPSQSVLPRTSNSGVKNLPNCAPVKLKTYAEKWHETILREVVFKAPENWPSWIPSSTASHSPKTPESSSVQKETRVEKTPRKMTRITSKRSFPFEASPLDQSMERMKALVTEVNSSLKKVQECRTILDATIDSSNLLSSPEELRRAAVCNDSHEMSGLLDFGDRGDEANSFQIGLEKVVIRDKSQRAFDKTFIASSSTTTTITTPSSNSTSHLQDSQGQANADDIPIVDESDDVVMVAEEPVDLNVTETPEEPETAQQDQDQIWENLTAPNPAIARQQISHESLTDKDKVSPGCSALESSSPIRDNVSVTVDHGYATQTQSQIISIVHDESRIRRSKPRTLSSRAGLVFPVRRLAKKLKKSTNCKVWKNSAVFLGAVLEYLVSEVLQLSSAIVRGRSRVRIQPRDVNFALRGDRDLDELTKNSVIPGVPIMKSMK